MVGADGVTVTLVITAEPTTSVAVPVIAALPVPLIAVIVTVPAPTGCASAVESTVATVGSDVDQLTWPVMSWDVWSENAPSAEY
jgi:hypothetical protein